MKLCLYIIGILVMPHDQENAEPQLALLIESVSPQKIKDLIKTFKDEHFPSNAWESLTITLELPAERIMDHITKKMYAVAFYAFGPDVYSNDLIPDNFACYIIEADSGKDAEALAVLRAEKNMDEFIHYSAIAEKIPRELITKVIQFRLH